MPMNKSVSHLFPLTFDPRRQKAAFEANGDRSGEFTFSPSGGRSVHFSAAPKGLAPGAMGGRTDAFVAHTNPSADGPTVWRFVRSPAPTDFPRAKCGQSDKAKNIARNWP
ncbi:hypothetical protein niasHS_001558 [Heterodera schachtii]|uniref:Uncharacterized protein n=1 Tax=Heterodera schachtii TaxID=97005 RepID=A0ABD2KE25_HETSC